jgi:hypothetical protein
LTGYFGEVYCRCLGASWIIKDNPDDVLIQIGQEQFPLYADACDTIRLFKPALTLRTPIIKKAGEDLLASRNLP